MRKAARIPRRRLPAALVTQLGKVPDAVLGKKYGFNRKTVAKRRWALKIKPVGKRNPFVWTAKALALVGTYTDKGMVCGWKNV